MRVHSISRLVGFSIRTTSAAKRSSHARIAMEGPPASVGPERPYPLRRHGVLVRTISVGVTVAGAAVAIHPGGPRGAARGVAGPEGGGGGPPGRGPRPHPPPANRGRGGPSASGTRRPARE